MLDVPWKCAHSSTSYGHVRNSSRRYHTIKMQNAASSHDATLFKGRSGHASTEDGIAEPWRLKHTIKRLQFSCSKDLLLERSFARKVSYENGFEVQLLEKIGSATRSSVQLLENETRAQRPWAQMPVLDAKTIFWDYRAKNGALIIPNFLSMHEDY